MKLQSLKCESNYQQHLHNNKLSYSYWPYRNKNSIPILYHLHSLSLSLKNPFRNISLLLLPFQFHHIFLSPLPLKSFQLSILITMAFLTNKGDSSSTFFFIDADMMCFWVLELKIPTIVLRVIWMTLCVIEVLTPSWMMSSQGEKKFLQNFSKPLKVQGFR